MDSFELSARIVPFFEDVISDGLSLSESMRRKKYRKDQSVPLRGACGSKEKELENTKKKARDRRMNLSKVYHSSRQEMVFSVSSPILDERT